MTEANAAGTAKGPGIVLQPEEGESYWQPVWANGYSTVKISPNGFPASRAADNCASASSPSSTEVECISQRSSIPSRIRRFVRLSSTTRTFTPRSTSGGGHRA